MYTATPALIARLGCLTSQWRLRNAGALPQDQQFALFFEFSPSKLVRPNHEVFLHDNLGWIDATVKKWRGVDDKRVTRTPSKSAAHNCVKAEMLFLLAKTLAWVNGQTVRAEVFTWFWEQTRTSHHPKPQMRVVVFNRCNLINSVSYFHQLLEILVQYDATSVWTESATPPSWAQQGTQTVSEERELQNFLGRRLIPKQFRQPWL